MLFQTFPDFFFQYYHKAHKNIAYSIENSLPQLAAKFFPQKGANLKSKKAHCGTLGLKRDQKGTNFDEKVPNRDFGPLKGT